MTECYECGRELNEPRSYDERYVPCDECAENSSWYAESYEEVNDGR